MQKYELRYLPIFYEDLERVLSYISETLDNPVAANRLLNDVENAIKQRLESPESYGVYETEKKRENPYYVIQIRNFMVFYVVLEEEKSRIMEVRRFLYARRNLKKLL